jgi:FAD/FMN-containing dehydrogenase
MTELAPPPADTATPTTTTAAVARLAAACPGLVHLPGAADYDNGRFAWNVAVDQRPAAVALPTTVEDVRTVVRHAAAAGLRVTTQTTGHAAAVLAGHRLEDVVLLRTGALRGVHVDPVARVARVEAGACWEDVVTAAAPYGLTALHGSAPDVGVVGYTLGGGLSWFARSHGLAANSVVALELVTADGEVVRTDAANRPELFWALRGGGGNFGVVTVIELALLPVADVYAGMMLWDVERAAEVLATFADWSPTAPEEVTTSFRIMRFPPIPELPDFLRGRSLAILDGAALLDDAAAAEVLAPFRALGPELDTFGRVPAPSLLGLHMDPPAPTPGVGASVVLDRLDEDAVGTFLAAVGPASGSSIFLAELRQLGGALSRSATGAGALGSVEGSHLAFFVTVAPTAEAAAAGTAEIEDAVATLAPWATGRSLLNFAERPVDPASGYDAEAWARLRRVKAEVDPHGLFLANHAI